MITKEKFRQISDDVAKSYPNSAGQIDQILEHGESWVVLITRRYQSTIGGRHTTEEKRVIIFHATSKGMRSMSDMIACTIDLG